MTRRYYAPELPPSGGELALSDEETRHASRVMRLQRGDAIVLFDGLGFEAKGTIQSIDKRMCTVKADAPAQMDREPNLKSHFAIGFPKPERAKEMIERLTEMGASQITPIICERTQRPPTESLLTKLRRIVIESSKQCERNVLMTIDAPVALKAFLATPNDHPRWIAHREGRPIQSVIQGQRGGRSATVLVGPEGGFTDEEFALATGSGFEPVGLGKRIYRIETAACAIAALLAE